MNTSSFTKDYLKSSLLFRATMTSVFALAFAVITLLIHSNPSGTGPPTPFPDTATAGVITIVGYIVLWSIFFSLTSISSKTLFLIMYSTSFAIILVTTIWFGLSLHRDYFTHIFQLVLIYWLLMIIRNDLFAAFHSNRQFYTLLFILNTVILTITLLWTMLMGYAIATRQEPRWTESLLYNVYNMVLVFFLGITSLRLHLKRFRTIRIIGDGLYIDDWDFTSYFSEIDKNIIIRFLTTEENLTCYMLEETIQSASLKTEADGNNGKVQKTAQWNCQDCLRNNHTTTKCPKYKNFYNRILKIKKLFETLELGTILTPENKMKIKEEGWKMRLFDDVRVSRIYH